MPDSVHLREAFKYALSIVLVYMIALSMDWSRPYWAAIAVTLCSLTTAGASLNKGIMRIIGCVFGCILALALVGFFAQERWHFMLAFMPCIFVLSIMMLISPYWYAYKKVILVCVLIVMGAHDDWDGTFSISVERTSETIMGVIVYMLVSALLWPRYAGDEVQPHLAPVFEYLATLNRLCHEQYDGAPVSFDFSQARRSFLASLPAAEETLSAAFYDTGRIRSHRRLWDRLRRDVREFYDATILLHESVGSFADLPRARALPDIHETTHRIQERMARIVNLWQSYPDAGNGDSGADASAMVPGTFDVDPVVKAGLSFKERAALVTFAEQIRILDEKSRELLALVRVLTGLDGRWKLNLRPVEAEPFPAPIWDPEVLLNAFRPVLTFVFVFLGWIYIENLPGGPLVITLTMVVVTFVIRNIPADPFRFARPFAIGLAVTAPVYFFVLPWLETPYGLCLFLFLFSLPWGYIGSRGDMFLKFFGMLTFLVASGINNAQVYSFAQFAQVSQILLWTIAFTALSFCFLPSSQPEKVLLRTLRSFFRSCARFVAARRYRQGAGRRRFPRASFLRARINGLPLRIRTPASALDYGVLQPTTVEQVYGLLDAVQSVAFRLRAFEDTRGRAYEHPGKLHETIGIMGMRMRARLQELLEGWARLEKIERLEERRLQYQQELRAIGDRLHEFGADPDLKDDHSLRVIFSTHATAAALMAALERLEDAVREMDLQQWGLPRFSKP